MDDHTHVQACMNVQHSHKEERDKVKHYMVNKNSVARDHQYLILYLWQKQ